MPFLLTPRISLLLALCLSGAAQADTLAEVNARLDARAPGALAAAEAFSRANAGSGEAWLALSRARLQARKVEPALDAAQQAVKLLPKNALAHYWLGNAYGARIGQVGMLSKMGLAPKLRDAFERAVSLDPSHLPSRAALIEFYLQAPGVIGGGIDKARAQATAIAGQDKARGLLAQGRIALYEKQPTVALGHYRAALATRTRDPEVLAQIAVALQQLEHWDEAFAMLRAWAKSEPGSGPAAYQFGRAAAVSGRFAEEGLAALQRYVGLKHAYTEPQDHHALYRIGQIHARAGRKAEARIALQAALKMEPQFPEAKAELGKL